MCVYTNIMYTSISLDELVGKYDLSRGFRMDLKFYVDRYNQIFDVYSDQHYLLNDPISVLDSDSFKELLLKKHDTTKKDLELFLQYIHDWLIHYEIYLDTLK